MTWNIWQVNIWTENQWIDKVPSSTQINEQLNQLQEQINNIPFEKKENWLFNLKFDGVVLDIDLTPEELVKAYWYLKSKIRYANSNDSRHSPVLFYSALSWNWKLKIDTRFKNPVYMRENDVTELFWQEKMNKIIEFLNNVLNINRDWDENNDILDWTLDSWSINFDESYNIYREIENNNQNIKNVSQLQKRPNRNESLIILKQLLLKWINWDLSQSVWYFSSITYDNIIFEVENSSIQINQKVNFQLSDNWSSIEIEQWWIVLWRYIIKDYNDQIILLLLSWKKTIEDFRVN